MQKYLVMINSNVMTANISDEKRLELIKAERRRGAELVEAGTILNMWRVPGQAANVTIWQAPDLDTLHELIISVPLWPYMKVEVTPLVTHPVMRKFETGED
jgi:muconolactone D-isomerase